MSGVGHTISKPLGAYILMEETLTCPCENPDAHLIPRSTNAFPAPIPSFLQFGLQSQDNPHPTWLLLTYPNTIYSPGPQTSATAFFQKPFPGLPTGPKAPISGQQGCLAPLHPAQHREGTYYNPIPCWHPARDNYCHLSSITRCTTFLFYIPQLLKSDGILWLIKMHSIFFLVVH